MKTIYLALAVSLAAQNAWSQTSLDEAFAAARQAVKSGAVAQAGIPGKAVSSPDEGPEASLTKAKAELEGVIKSLDAMIKAELDRAKKADLYELKDQAQRALNEVAKSLDGLAKDGSRSAQGAKLDQILAEAKFLNKVLASYLGTPDFSGTVHMKQQPFEFEVGADVIYDAVSKKLPFLRGGVQGRVRINPGAEMVSQFNSLKAEYYTTLLDAAQALKDMGKDPMADARFNGMAQWGHDTKVIAPGQGWMKAVEILTWDQYNSLRR